MRARYPDERGADQAGGTPRDGAGHDLTAARISIHTNAGGCAAVAAQSDDAGPAQSHATERDGIARRARGDVCDEWRSMLAGTAVLQRHNLPVMCAALGGG